ncbi:hypothetical protein [Staphylococcus arlettae]|uniref:hypothetical protein n=2 Tax=Staphylococcus arlettae TaxID=29378 RepID=UPI0021D2B264|nr:hypothetical protein [Staphylococcus arlettae]UXU50060.1 hypothetical protein MUA37_00730 [Staphylococcus arlettae]UXU52697.1 hypothetical protein MUA71_01080 [Staphylococcus arlettae]
MFTINDYYKSLSDENKKDEIINLEDIINTLKLLDVMGYDETFIKIIDVIIIDKLKDIDTSDNIHLKIHYAIVKENDIQKEDFEIILPLEIIKVEKGTEVIKPQKTFVSVENINMIISKLFEKIAEYKRYLKTIIDISNIDGFQHTGLYDEEHRINTISKLTVMKTLDGDILTRYIFGNEDYEIERSVIYRIFELDKQIFPENIIDEFLNHVRNATIKLGIKSPQELMQSLRYNGKNSITIAPSKDLEGAESIEIKLP